MIEKNLFCQQYVLQNSGEREKDDIFCLILFLSANKKVSWLSPLQVQLIPMYFAAFKSLQTGFFLGGEGGREGACQGRQLGSAFKNTLQSQCKCLPFPSGVKCYFCGFCLLRGYPPKSVTLFAEFFFRKREGRGTPPQLRNLFLGTKIECFLSKN